MRLPVCTIYSMGGVGMPEVGMCVATPDVHEKWNSGSVVKKRQFVMLNYCALWKQLVLVERLTIVRMNPPCRSGSTPTSLLKTISLHPAGQVYSDWGILLPVGTTQERRDLT